MRKIALLDRDTAATMKAAIRRSKDDAQKSRIRTLLRVKQGVPHKRVAEEGWLSRSSLISWIKAYNEGGIDALKMSKGGRSEGNPKWEQEIFEALTKEIDKGERYWSVPVMVFWIKERYGREIPKNTVWYHVRNLDYSYKSARPSPVKGDPQAQAAFKKGV